MKIEKFRKVLETMPFGMDTVIIRKDPEIHCAGVINDIVGTSPIDCVVINMAVQDDFFMHELRELIAFRKGQKFACLFDFTSGCSTPDSELKSNLMKLLINRRHNGFEIPDNVKVIIYDNIEEETEFTPNKFDTCMFDKCLRFTIEP